MMIDDRANLYVELVLPLSIALSDNRRRLAYRRVIDPLELEDLMIAMPPPPHPETDPTFYSYRVLQYQEQRRKADHICKMLGDNIAFALRKGLTDGVA